MKYGNYNNKDSVFHLVLYQFPQISLVALKQQFGWNIISSISSFETTVWSIISSIFPTAPSNSFCNTFPILVIRFYYKHELLNHIAFHHKQCNVFTSQMPTVKQITTSSVKMDNSESNLKFVCLTMCVRKHVKTDNFLINHVTTKNNWYVFLSTFLLHSFKYTCNYIINSEQLAFLCLRYIFCSKDIKFYTVPICLYSLQTVG